MIPKFDPAPVPRNLTSCARAPSQKILSSPLSIDRGSSAAVSPSSSLISRRKKTIFLLDWWVEPVIGDDGKGLSVCGLEIKDVVGGERETTPLSQWLKYRSCCVDSQPMLNPRQTTDRVFHSAPIIKRFDTFTLKTGDGILLRLLGVINIENALHHGFPLEVCNHFLIGFPYNWDDLIEEYVGRESPPEGMAAKASCIAAKASSDDELSTHLDEFSMSMDFSFLASTCDAPRDNLTTNFADILKRFCSNMSIPHVSRLNSCLQEEDISKWKNKINRNDEDNMGLAASLDHDAEVHPTGLAEVKKFHESDVGSGVIGESSTRYFSSRQGFKCCVEKPGGLEANLEAPSRKLYMKAVTSSNTSKKRKQVEAGSATKFSKDSVEVESELHVSVDWSPLKDGAELDGVGIEVKKERRRKPKYQEVNQPPLTRHKAQKLVLSSPEPRSLRRSRLGPLGKQKKVL